LLAIQNCKSCGKVFDYNGIGAKLCPVCKKIDEEDFKRVKEYLYEHPGASMTEVSSVLELPVSQIKRYLKEGRLEIIDNHHFVLQCERCGVSIKTGRYCEDCLIEITKNLRSVANQASNSEAVKPDFNREGKMRYLNRKLNERS